MDNGKIMRIPISGSERRRNEIGRLGASCLVSGRWITFGPQAHGPFREGEYLDMDVWTEGVDGEPRKLCSLVVTREDILRAIGNVAKPSDDA